MGLAAAVGATLSTMLIAAIGAWYGGWVDGLIQRITELHLILPVLPILIMVGTLYNRSLVVIIGLFVLLSVFSGGIKTYRSEEHTSELQSRENLVCRLLLEKKK